MNGFVGPRVPGGKHASSVSRALSRPRATSTRLSRIALRECGDECCRTLQSSRTLDDGRHSDILLGPCCSWEYRAARSLEAPYEVPLAAARKAARRVRSDATQTPFDPGETADGMLLSTGVIATISSPLFSSPIRGSGSCILKVTVADPPGRHMHVGGLRWSPLHSTTPLVVEQLPTLLPSTASMVSPAGALQSIVST